MDLLPALLKDLGSAIRVLRGPTGLSQEHFGDAIGIHRTEIGRLERGQVNPTVATLYLVAGGLGVSVAELFARAERQEGGAGAGGPSLGGVTDKQQPGKAAGRSKRAAKPSRRRRHTGRRGK